MGTMYVLTVIMESYAEPREQLNGNEVHTTAKTKTFGHFVRIPGVISYYPTTTL